MEPAVFKIETTRWISPDLLLMAYGPLHGTWTGGDTGNGTITIGNNGSCLVHAPAPDECELFCIIY